MIIARIIINVLPEKKKELVQTLLSIIEPPGEENAYLNYDIFCDIKNKKVFNVISNGK